jgi:hypothetical protein
VRGTTKSTQAVITKGAALVALKIVSAYRKGKPGVTDKATTAALKTIEAYVRQREAKVQSEARGLGVKAIPPASCGSER